MSSQLFKAAAELSEEEAQFTDFYSSSLRLPRELFQIEVLYNLGRAFHQVGSVVCCGIDRSGECRHSVLQESAGGCKVGEKPSSTNPLDLGHVLPREGGCFQSVCDLEIIGSEPYGCVNPTTLFVL